MTAIEAVPDRSTPALADRWCPLSPGGHYRVSRGVDEPKLRNARVVFLGWYKVPWDVHRAEVRLEDGTETWLLKPNLLIST